MLKRAHATDRSCVKEVPSTLLGSRDYEAHSLGAYGKPKEPDPTLLHPAQITTSRLTSAEFATPPAGTYPMVPISGFLGLPRELRDIVYELVATGEQSLVVKTEPPTANRCQLASRSRLILTCKQLHNEYLENLLANVLKPGNCIKIGVTVTDCDFTRAFEFFCQLTPPQRIATLNMVDLEIKLVFREPE
ncbi:hypothetical protein LTS16_009311 [Friedmanniomyces endolithicus]|nr:hypothetical protein LTR35_014239 [Friedmanniomyces endolithicus]KAK1041732.1 hypothetical protein LTS16_009311 [Friedmanniomyces endolithicus]